MRRQQNKAFSLLEIIIAMGIAGAVVVTMFTFLGFVFQGIKHGKLSAQGTALASKYIEKVKGDNEFALAIAALTSPYTEDEIVIDPITGEPRTYTVTLDMNPAITGSSLEDLVVKVEWVEERKTGKVVVETYINLPK